MTPRFVAAEGVQRIERIRNHFNTLTLWPIFFYLAQFILVSPILILHPSRLKIDNAKRGEVCIASLLSKPYLPLGFS